MAKKLSSEDILRAVERDRNRTQELRQRMEDDFGFYSLNPFEEIDEETGLVIKDNHYYTSNEPQVFADRIKSWLAQSVANVRIPQGLKKREQRKVDSVAERFVIGALKAADDRLEQRQEGKLQGQVAWYATLRGIICGRWLMYKEEEDGDVIIDVEPWDPLYTSWRSGKNGLVWICYTSTKTAQEIADEYELTLADLDADEGDMEVTVHDFYDLYDNTLITSTGKVLKK